MLVVLVFGVTHPDERCSLCRCGMVDGRRHVMALGFWFGATGFAVLLMQDAPACPATANPSKLSAAVSAVVFPPRRE
jgi:hypothetical protein